jgi:hypothetical protein
MPSTNNPMRNAPHLDVEFAHRLADKLFPAWAEMKRLVAQIEQLERDRVQLLKTEVRHFHPDCISRHALTFQLPEIEGLSDEMHHEKKRADDLIYKIRVFECGQNIRIQKIEQKILNAEALIDDIKAGEKEAEDKRIVEILQHGRMLPAVNSHLNWEIDTEVGDEGAKLDGFTIGIFQFKANFVR